ncbi:DUF2235 domain-containing protein [Bradyrhizobium erythrophlei]|uniref:DUF2235 domain-containing protein n=1 Tax=Bradyrhizobium erythrophlei TaxID=1437360 RepID=UPI0035EA3B46
MQILEKQWEEAGGGSGGSSRSSSQRKSKHIILGIDGTWQAAFRDPFQSNVHRLNVALNYEDNTDNHNPQIFIYSAGVGTNNRSSQIIAGATGEGLGSIILEAYINLASNYVPGDKIYIFGFSRGAFAARALTGFISYSGLLKANSLSLTEQAWRHFTDPKGADFNYPEQKADATHKKVEVEFLGVWDTVAGPYKKQEVMEKFRFKHLKLDPIVKCGVHILSIDESRGDYEPVLWNGPSRDGQTLEQIWMPGVHADIGGGYSEAFLSTTSLLVMIDKLHEHCLDLSFDTNYIEETLLDIIEKQDPIVNNERTGFWKYFGRSLLRRIESTEHHKQHPIVELLRQRQIVYKSRQKAYSPSFLAPAGTLKIAEFGSISCHTSKVMSILTRRLS